MRLTTNEWMSNNTMCIYIYTYLFKYVQKDAITKFLFHAGFFRLFSTEKLQIWIPKAQPKEKINTWWTFLCFTLLGTNISHLGKRKIIFKSALGWDMLVPWRVVTSIHFLISWTISLCNIYLIFYLCISTREACSVWLLLFNKPFICSWSKPMSTLKHQFRDILPNTCIFQLCKKNLPCG